jgi:hypothetical protein
MASLLPRHEYFMVSAKYTQKELEGSPFVFPYGTRYYAYRHQQGGDFGTCTHTASGRRHRVFTSLHPPVD